jgi:hypothetical protein
MELGGREVRLVTAQDVTESKRLEEERSRVLLLEQEARRKAEGAVRLRDDVLQMVSHDLRSPISTVVMAAAALKQSRSEAQQAQCVEAIQRTAKYMQRLVQGLLDLGRIEAGRGVPLDTRSVEVEWLLARAADLFTIEAEQTRVTLVRRVSAQTPAVRADPERLLQVLWNLTGNAVKFAPAGTEVTLTSRALFSTGPFTNTGTLPPKAEEETTYTVLFTTGNTQNDIENARVTAVLGPNVSWVSASGEDISYNPSNNTVTWNLGTLASGASVEHRIDKWTHHRESLIEHVRYGEQGSFCLGSVASLPQVTIRHDELPRQGDAASLELRRERRLLRLRRH